MKRYGILIAVALALVAGAAWAQPQVEWSIRCAGNRNPYDDQFCNAVIQTSDSGFVFGCTQGCLERLIGDFWLIKTNSAGDTLWSKAFGQRNRWEMCNSLISTNDSGFAMAGNSATGGAGTNDFCLMKVAQDGGLDWSHSFGGGRDDICGKVIETSDGGFLLAGRTMSYGAGLWDIWLVRTDSAGSEVWRRTYGGREDDYLGSIIVTNDGGFAIGGTKETDNKRGFWLIKLDANGDSLWSTSCFGPSNLECKDIVETSDNGFVLVGWVQTEAYGDAFLLRTNADGDSLWSRQLDQGMGDGCNSIIALECGGFVLGGYCDQGFMGGQFSILHIDDAGNNIWQLKCGVDLMCVGKALIRTFDNGYVLAGNASAWGDSTEIDDLYLVKTTPDPVSVRDPAPLTPYTLLLSPAFPNPFNSTTRIAFGLDKSAPTRLQIFDPLGRRVAELIPNRVLSAGRHEAVWDADGLTSGIYIVRLSTSSGNVATKKLVLLK